MRKISWMLVVLGLLLPSFNGRALADQIAASSSLDWASATFSGSVAPTGAGGNPASPSEGAFAFYQTTSGNSILWCAVNAFGWTPIGCNVQAGPDFATSSVDAELAAMAAASQGYSSSAAIYREGTIVVGVDGDVNIAIPFSATITPTEAGNCGPSCTYLAQVAGYIFLYSTSPTPPFGDSVSWASIGDIGRFNVSDGSRSISGTLDLSDTGLAPGTYRFDVQLINKVDFVPEPSTMVLLGIGLLGLAGISFRKRRRAALQ